MDLAHQVCDKRYKVKTMTPEVRANKKIHVEGAEAERIFELMSKAVFCEECCFNWAGKCCYESVKKNVSDKDFCSKGMRKNDY